MGYKLGVMGIYGLSPSISPVHIVVIYVVFLYILSFQLITCLVTETVCQPITGPR